MNVVSVLVLWQKLGLLFITVNKLVVAVVVVRVRHLYFQVHVILHVFVYQF